MGQAKLRKMRMGASYGVTPNLEPFKRLALPWYLQMRELLPPDYHPDFGHLALVDGQGETEFNFYFENFSAAIDRNDVAIGATIPSPCPHAITIFCRLSKFERASGGRLRLGNFYRAGVPIAVNCRLAPGERFLSGDRRQWVIPFRAGDVVVG